MAKVVIAGSSNCPHFARIELLADQLHHSLPAFHLHKIVKQPHEWSEWLTSECSKNGWKHEKSPLVWRELVDRGGKGVLIGGANEFQEYVNCYYEVKSDLMSSAMQNVAQDNVRFKDAEESEERYLKSLSNPVKICITNAASSCAYNLIPRIAKGDVFGKNVELSCILHDSEENMSVLAGVQMELFDLASQLVRQISVTNDLSKAVKGAAVVVVLDEMIQGEEESREDFLRRCAEHFTELACILDRECSADTKVLLCGTGPLNFGVYMMLQSINNLQRYNIVALPRLFERQVKAELASKMNVNSAGVTDVVIWGNPSGKCHIDLSRCRVFGYDGSIVGPPSFSLPTQDAVWDKRWLRNELQMICSERGARVTEVKAPAPSNAMAKANCVVDFLQEWINGSPGKQMYSLCVRSRGWYGIPEGVVFSFPVIFHPRGYWSVVEDMELSDEGYSVLNECVQDLVAEKEVIFPTAPPETMTTDMFGSSLAPTAMDTFQPDKTPLEKLEECIAHETPENANLLKSEFLANATADQLVAWVDDRHAFLAEVRDFLKNRGRLRTTTQQESSDEMMTVNESDGVAITDDEVTAAAAEAASSDAKGENDLEK